MLYATRLELAIAGVAIAAGAFTAGLIVGNSEQPHYVAPNTALAEPADWTLAPCSLWADDSDPKLPPYTITNACVADDGTISLAPETTIQLETK